MIALGQHPTLPPIEKCKQEVLFCSDRPYAHPSPSPVRGNGRSRGALTCSLSGKSNRKVSTTTSLSPYTTDACTGGSLSNSSIATSCSNSGGRERLVPRR